MIDSTMPRAVILALLMMTCLVRLPLLVVQGFQFSPTPKQLGVLLVVSCRRRCRRRHHVSVWSSSKDSNFSNESSSSSSSSSSSQHQRQHQQDQEMLFEELSRSGAKKIASMSVPERAKRAMLGEAIEDRIFEKTELLEQIMIEVQHGDGIVAALPAGQRERAVELATQIRTLQVQYRELVRGEPSSVLQALETVIPNNDSKESKFHHGDDDTDDDDDDDDNNDEEEEVVDDEEEVEPLS